MQSALTEVAIEIEEAMSGINVEERVGEGDE